MITATINQGFDYNFIYHKFYVTLKYVYIKFLFYLSSEPIELVSSHSSVGSNIYKQNENQKYYLIYA